jgi:2-polyprenyl-3-methyl-5-hydroxy-6-metoxy-1,4-benzoquinol methylase
VPDYRTDLYQRYDSTFKKEARQAQRTTDAVFFHYCNHKFRHILDPMPRDSAILEAGCGPGRMMRYLHSLGFSNVKGVDVSNEQAELAKADGLNVDASDIFDFLRSSQGAYDAIVAIDFLEHFTKDELMTLAPLIHGALREGGTLALQTPNGEGLFPQQIIYGDLTHCTVMTPSSLTQLLSSTRFESFRFFETGPVPGNLVRLARIVLWKGIKMLANGVRMIEAGKRQDLWTENMICACTKRPGSVPGGRGGRVPLPSGARGV